MCRTTNLVSYVVVQHADHRRSLAVRDGIKYFIHLRRMAHIHLEHGDVVRVRRQIS